MYIHVEKKPTSLELYYSTFVSPSLFAVSYHFKDVETLRERERERERESYACVWENSVCVYVYERERERANGSIYWKY